MKKTLALALTFCVLTYCSVSAAVVAPSVVAPASVAPAIVADPAKPTPPNALSPLKASDVRIPIGNTGKSVTLLELSTMNVDDLQHLTGQKMGWLKRMEFKVALRKLRHSVKPDGTVDIKSLNKLRRGYYDEDGSFHIGGFALGFFLGAIGVLIAYLINDDYHHARVKWAWIGFGTFLVLYLILVIAVLSSTGA
jgi:hypothetical protein